MSETSQSRTTSAGMWRYAKAFADSANELDDHRSNEVLVPVYYLYGHAIELALKAYLITVNVPLDELRSRALGHDLKALLNLAFANDINDIVSISQTDGDVVTLLNSEYSAKRFEYIQAGMMSLPDRRLLCDFVTKLIRELEDHCIQFTLRLAVDY